MEDVCCNVVCIGLALLNSLFVVSWPYGGTVSNQKALATLATADHTLN